ncbi:hypothetical protein CHLORIS_170 [Vibrio phage Chloris]|nr:hypothetical protein CHLORIS_170 [Vibrio phage Chloris]
MRLQFGAKLNPDVNYFITSDLHFFHTNIMKFCPETRPWADHNEMTEALIAHWNSIVGEDDVVFHLGDFSFAGMEKTQAVLDRLNGTIVFVMGNHDKTVRNQLKSPNKFEYLEVTYNKIKICMFHYAMRVWNMQHHGSIHFYGHSHGSLEGTGRSMDVGYDAHGRILPLDWAVKQMQKIQDIETEDHH